MRYKKCLVAIFSMVMLVFAGCSNGVSKEQRISSMLSDEEGKYYITILGASQNIEKKFESEIFQNNINKISGYYLNENPNDAEIRDLEVKETPIFIVFDKENEVYRTNNINDLNDYLVKK
ncbi:hypothetical protein [Paenibacillus sedimenti]|uniref:Lipoprotein n=1 Tax=Paenibacillus sedimenti TaxID=2770274 RepID=A0A926KXL4_9BACL|nr:hypothetical protein [Paenibacillus sedimenti]MBD0384113.1 hypothetical protein [Paenibacillus sedimenti]